MDFNTEFEEDSTLRSEGCFMFDPQRTRTIRVISPQSGRRVYGYRSSNGRLSKWFLPISILG